MLDIISSKQLEAGSFLNLTGKSQGMQNPPLYQQKLETFQQIPNHNFLLNTRNNLGCTKQVVSSEFECSTGI